MTRGRSKKSNEETVTAAAAATNRTAAKRSSEETVASSATTTPPAAKKPKKTEKTTYASKKRLQDDTSDFNKSRLDHSTPHFPEPVDNSNRGKCCILCRYATGGKKYITNLLGCSRCNVKLCVWCFKLFHTAPSISAVKEDICKEIAKRLEGKKERVKANKDNGKRAFKGIK